MTAPPGYRLLKPIVGYKKKQFNKPNGEAVLLKAIHTTQENIANTLVSINKSLDRKIEVKMPKPDAAWDFDITRDDRGRVKSLSATRKP